MYIALDRYCNYVHATERIISLSLIIKKLCTSLWNFKAHFRFEPLKPEVVSICEVFLVRLIIFSSINWYGRMSTLSIWIITNWGIVSSRTQSQYLISAISDLHFIETLTNISDRQLVNRLHECRVSLGKVSWLWVNQQTFQSSIGENVHNISGHLSGMFKML